MKLQVPEFLTRLPAALKRKRAKPRPSLKLRAATAARRMSPAMNDDLDEEPTTRLSSAFFVVLILHLVAVGGIWAFNSIKAHRRGIEPPASISATKAAAQPAADAKPQPSASAAPAGAGAKPQPALAALAAPAPASIANGKFYVVKPNDTLTKIAVSLSVSIAEIQALNLAKDITVLRPGQIINVPSKKTVETPALVAAQKKVESTPARTSAERTYEVQKGDTATSIAKRFGVPVDELLKTNNVKDAKKLQLGQSLKVPAKKVN
jgi:LysM repeat protein